MSQSKFSRIAFSLLLAVAILIAPGALSGTMPANAQSAKKDLTDTLGDVFRDALRGPKDGQAETGDDLRRVPETRSEVVQSFAPLVKKSAPAVVNVYADRTVVRRSPFEGDPFFKQFFGRAPGGRAQKQSSLGSGVIVDRSGIIVTNNHVISGADEIRVALSDGREFDSKVILKDERFDLAVLKIDGKNDFPTLQLGDSDALEVGDMVLAIGNPFGVGQTVTSGIVSALARNRVGVSDFGFFIQTDAAINPGNSGGALVDMHGDLIGINTAIFSRSGGSNGIGFAIPANLVRAFALSAESGSDHFDPPYIGASFQPVTPDIAEALGLENASGALIVSVEADGPAAKAGLKPGEIVSAFNGQTVEHPDALGYRLATAAAGQTIKLSVTGQAGMRDVEIKLEKTPEGKLVKAVAITGDSPFAGVSVIPLDASGARQLRLPAEIKGLVVTDVDRNSPAGQYGFLPKDVITAINGDPVETADQLQAALDEDGFFLRFDLIRNGQRIRQMINR